MPSNRGNERRGVILMVVLALLTLFALIGLTFVLYADSEATATRVAREAETAQRPDVDPEQALAFFLGQLIYDLPDDTTGVGSGLRGHSLVRNLYGLNYVMEFGQTTFLSTLTPYCGVGRLHYANPALNNADDYFLINYTWFPNDGFVRDPERFGVRANSDLLGLVQNNPYVAGNPSYTYADLNNFYLAAMKADGTVLVPSYHRNYTGFGSLDPGNPNWFNTTDPTLKYKVLRPRPADNPPNNGRPGFPAPDDAGGDVKNLVGTPGGNDSIWIDIGAPVMTAKDGTRYKMLVAPLVLDLDGRINLNAAGNLLGSSNSHVSYQGWGPWEVNLAKVLPGESQNLFVGRSLGANTVFGKYAPNPTPPPAFTPAAPGSPAVFGTLPHFYAPVDFNGLNEAAPGSASSRPLPPTAASCFPAFLQGYLNAGPSEVTNHPLLYNPSQTPNQFFNNVKTRVFQPFDMEALLRPNNLGQTRVDAGSSALLTDLIRLCPQNLGPSANPRFRNFVTTISNDILLSPGVTAYWYTLNGVPPSPYPIQPVANPTVAPVSNAVPFPTVTAGQPLPTIGNFFFPPALSSEFNLDWTAATAISGRISLSQGQSFSLFPPYPHMGANVGSDGFGGGPSFQQPISPYGTAYDLSGTTQQSFGIQLQFLVAQNARQSLAFFIYQTLLGITGVTQPANPEAPTPAELAPLRWLAQLAVNIVDYLDDDDICTPFNFYTAVSYSSQLGFTQGSDDNGTNPNGSQTGANPLYWVFGTELPKVVLNEVLAQTPNADPKAPVAAGGAPVKLWVELCNTMQAPVPANTQPQDAYRVPFFMTLPNGAPGGYSPYRISICQNLMPSGAAPAPLPDASANVLGKGNIAAPFPQSTTDLDFQNGAALIGGGNQAVFTDPVSNGTVNAGVDPQGYLLLGPQTLPGGQFQDPFVAAAGGKPGVPGNTPVVRTDNMGYTANWVANATTDERTTGMTVLLRRLANPYLPFDPRQALEDPFFPGFFFPNPNYNPYLTIDYIQNVPLHSSTNPPGTFPLASRGKRQPYAALTLLAPPAGGNPANAAALQATSPVTDQTANPAPGQPGAITANNVTHTFGMPNFPLPQSGHYDWLVHLDRQPISPLELLHVSGYQPYQLTQQFISGTGDDTIPTNMFRHYVPWLDGLPAAGANVAAPWWFDPAPAPGQTHRLYRLFEFLDCGKRNSSDVLISLNNPGRVNINSIWDPEILRAICDANPSIGIAGDSAIDTMFSNMLQLRSPNGAPGPNDRPFLPLSVGLNLPGGTQYPNGTSVTTDTLLRLAPGGNSGLLLFQNPADNATVHPYLQAQLLTKMYNSLTTRSNVFAVWLTAGFFEVTPAGTLGAEIGRTEGRHIRHRMFAIVDRTFAFLPLHNPGQAYDPRQDSGTVLYYSLID